MYTNILKRMHVFTHDLKYAKNKYKYKSIPRPNAKIHKSVPNITNEYLYLNTAHLCVIFG